MSGAVIVLIVALMIWNLVTGTVNHPVVHL